MRSAIVGFVALFAAAAGAAEHPCKEDAEKLCKGVEPGEGRIVRCLKQHEAELSAACKEKRDSFRELVVGRGRVCGHDANRLTFAERST